MGCRRCCGCIGFRLCLAPLLSADPSGFWLTGYPPSGAVFPIALAQTAVRSPPLMLALAWLGLGKELKQNSIHGLVNNAQQCHNKEVTGGQKNLHNCKWQALSVHKVRKGTGLHPGKSPIQAVHSRQGVGLV